MPPKFLIAVSSCQQDAAKGDHNVIRETWGKTADELGVPYIINVGGAAAPPLETHEVFTKCRDTWEALPLKTLENCKTALHGGFDFMFQCFRDTYISIPRLLYHWQWIQTSNEDVIGNHYFHGVYEPYPCGGSGYWMSAEFMELLLKAGTLGIESEDRLVGEVMTRNKIVGFHDNRYDHLTMRGGVSKHNSNITNHLWSHYNRYMQRALGITDWNPDWLRQEQKKELTGQHTEQDIAYFKRIPQMMEWYRYL